jgi:hypothetical protein
MLAATPTAVLTAVAPLDLLAFGIATVGGAELSWKLPLTVAIIIVGTVITLRACFLAPRLH